MPVANAIVYPNYRRQSRHFKKSIVATQSEQQKTASVANLPDVSVCKMGRKNREGIAQYHKKDIAEPDARNKAEASPDAVFQALLYYCK